LAAAPRPGIATRVPVVVAGVTVVLAAVLLALGAVVVGLVLLVVGLGAGAVLARQTAKPPPGGGR
jgi:hypothetical protein